VLSVVSFVADEAAATDELTPVLSSVLSVPQPVLQSDGHWKLAYELDLTNASDSPLTIDNIEVLAPGRDDAIVASIAADLIAPNLALPGGQKSATLGPAQAGLLFVNLTFDRPGEIPAKLVHNITVTISNPRGSMPPQSVEHRVGPTNVLLAAPIVIGPPLRGDRWIAGASCCDSYHRRAALPINGRRFLAQRFAIDWIRIDSEHRLASGDPARNESYPQFGAEALAVANATVVHVTDDIPQQAPGSFPSGVTIATADGNSVVLDLGGGHFALYAHFQPASIRVHEGQHVKRGQVLGLVGNSGNSDAPHLHFHVMDGPSPLASNGQPYVIDAFELQGQAVSADDLESQLKKAQEPIEIVPESGPAQRTKELPADLTVVRFPE